MAEPESPQLRRERLAGVVAACVVCLALPTVVLLASDVPGGTPERREPVLWLVGAAAVGAAVPLLFWAPFRALGFAPLAAVGWLVAVYYGMTSGHWPGWAHGLPLGVVVGAVARGSRGPQPSEETTGLVFAVGVGVAFAWAFTARDRPYDTAHYFLLVAAVGLLVWTWARLFRPLFELACEPVVWVMYRVRGRGPGLASVPRTGPCVVLANHACWLDPLFLAKVLPRPITPMMTAKFYDLPFLRRLMPLFGVVRVPEKAVKKDAPEIREAIAALDRGECVVIFPEGYLRRSDAHELRRFGQGVWHILNARPGTPVFACWIDGNWGSYTSYRGGPPTKGKRPDFRRPIGVGVSDPVSLPAEVLGGHLPTRIHLMNLVAAARAHLGLPPLPPFELPARDDRADDPGELASGAE